jgi:protein phosphatase
LKITIPNGSVVALIGASGSGKSTFARTHFLATEVLSSDYFRGLVSDDENDQEASRDAFEALYFVAGRRLDNGRTTVIDATNVQADARKPLVALARDHDMMAVAIVLNLPESLCLERNRSRPDRDFGPHVVRRQVQQLRQSIRSLQREGFRYVYVLSSPDEVAEATIERQRLWTDRREEHGPFDIIGDVHGCYEELVALLSDLGYQVQGTRDEPEVVPPAGRKAIFLGDLVDRGPDTPGVLRLVMSMVASSSALCVPGNHDVKLMRKLQGRNVQLTHGLAESVAQLEAETPQFQQRVAEFIDGLVSHFVLDEGRLVVAHAGMKQAFQGRASGRVRDFALYGETTGETDDFGLPVRYDWAAEYRGKARVVYGHTPVATPQWLNNTLCIDTGCVFGGKLTALRHPENEVVSVPAAKTYYEPLRPVPAMQTQGDEELLDLNDVLGRRAISTALMGNVTIPQENAAAALEVMSRFAIDPRWLIYLPPTMSPAEASKLTGLLEHPIEAFDYFRAQGLQSVVCEVKHMGSRAIAIVGKSGEAIKTRFGVDGSAGIIYTRTGRRFFNDSGEEESVLEALAGAAARSGLWEHLATDWLCLDCEVMPWSIKAGSLIDGEYAPIAIASATARSAEEASLRKASARGLDVSNLLDLASERTAAASGYAAALTRFATPFARPSDIRVAPFHLLASEGAIHVDKPHTWHMELLGRFCDTGGDLLTPTDWVEVKLDDEPSVERGVAWWQELTAAGAEGMVVKPEAFVARTQKGRLVQPALKVRGSEYLRLIYGPEYSLPGNLSRLRSRGLGAKRSLAAREFALGLEALQRFVDREPLWRVHECVFGVLALESEPVDPRL